MKLCRICDEFKPLDEFYRMAGMRDGHRNECKSCNNRQKHERYMANPEPARRRTKEWQAANPERYAAKQREWRDSGGKARSNRKSHLKRKFNLSSEDYAARLADQGGRCAICHAEPGLGKALDVDHDHKTGQVRGLLCRNCNHGLGKFKDDPFTMTEARFYLLNWDREVPDRVRLVIGG